jgi:hypothetical protein
MSFFSNLSAADQAALLAMGSGIGAPTKPYMAYLETIYTKLFGHGALPGEGEGGLIKLLHKHPHTSVNSLLISIADHANAADQGALLAQLPPPPPTPFTLTTGQDTFVGHGGDTFNAGLGGVFGTQPTLTTGDSLIDTGTGNVLNATFNGTDTVTGLTIQGIETWNINANLPPPTIPGLPGESSSSSAGTITLTGTSTSISGLRTLNFNDNSTTGSLLIGDNAEPVQEPHGANGFTINVSNAVGTGQNGVDVDIAAAAFTGNDTINVSANIVGGFPEVNGSFVIPPLVTGTTGDPDNYCPNWDGYGDLAFAISAGASAGPNGPVGFANWNVSSTGAAAIGSLNILALGGEGSMSAKTLTLTDDGSNTMLYATLLSDSLLSDWTNLATINLAGTSGFVTLTGAEVCDDDNDSSSDMFGGLLTDATNIHTIIGGQGNSFYDLTSETVSAAAAGSFDGGHGVKGNSEIAFSNAVLTAGVPVHISHVQVLDDVSSAQGGTIDMADFAGLGPLNVPYTLLGGGIIPAGYELLQLLGAHGCTATACISDILIDNSAAKFAVNMQDLADGTFTPPVSVSLTVDSTDYNAWNNGAWGGCNLTISGVSNAANTSLILYVSDDGVCLGNGVTALNIPNVTIENYATTDIYLPFEGITGDVNGYGGTAQPNFVILGSGSTGFIDAIAPQLTNVTLNFHDNTADTGGSDPGGPDNLILGNTNFTQCLTTDNIGVASVIFDTIAPHHVTATINDFGAGSFEIGATNATNINAQSTSHLIMDLPGTDTADGIVVNGSLTGQNLLQGTSSQVFNDYWGHDGNTFESFSVGNDTLTGGAGKYGVANDNGNTGDNFFTEGGNDTVNINSQSAVLHNANTIWIGSYDVSNSGDWSQYNSGVGHTYEQAITDLSNSSTGESFVDGYGGSNVVTVNGFTVGSPGDTVNFATSSWASYLNVKGLVQSDGSTSVSSSSHDASFAFIHTDHKIDTGDVILDTQGAPFLDSAHLQTALLQENVSNFNMAHGVASGATVDMLIAYTSTNSQIRIADLTLHNGTSGTLFDTAQFTGSNASLSVHDLVDINVTGGAGLGNLAAHNIHFFA